MKTEFMVRVNLKAVLRPSCWAFGHVWEDYTVIHPAWNSEGRHCLVCNKQQFVRHDFEFEEIEPNHFDTISVRTDWNGTTRTKTVSHGSGTPDDPIRYEHVAVPDKSAGGDE